MSTTSGSVRIEVRLNGVVVATAGIEEYGVLTTLLTWALHDPDDIPEHVRSDSDPENDRDEWLAEELSLHVGGLDSPTEEHLYWLDKDLTVGDEVTLRVLPPGPVDAPVRKGITFCNGRPETTDDAGYA